MTSINTGLLAEHKVTKIFAHKICFIYTENWGELGGGARQSPRRMEAEMFWKGKGKSDSGPAGLGVGHKVKARSRG